MKQSNYSSVVTNATTAAGGTNLLEQLADSFSSINAADFVIDAVIHKVAHIQYMKDLEKKVKPYVIGYTVSQNCCVEQLVSLKPDCKADDQFIDLKCQEEDLEEPRNLKRDGHMPEQEIKKRDEMARIVIEPGSPSSRSSWHLNPSDIQSARKAQVTANRGLTQASSFMHKSGTMELGSIEMKMNGMMNKTKSTMGDRKVSVGSRKNSAQNPKDFQLKQDFPNKRGSRKPSKVSSNYEEPLSAGRASSQDSLTKRNRRTGGISKQDLTEYY